MTPPAGAPRQLPCPVCGRPVPGPGPDPCATCGLPAAGQAALVVARIGATLDELGRDRDRLLATLRAAAPGPAPVAAWAPPAPREAPAAGLRHAQPWGAPAWDAGSGTDRSSAATWTAAPPAAPGIRTPPGPGAWAAPGGGAPPTDGGPAGPGGPGRPAGPGDPAGPSGPAPVPPPPARRRLSPQQVLLGLGALLVVAAAIAFVAVAWTRLGLAFQAVAMLAVTAAACATSAWAARRGLRATEEALAAAGAALLVVDLGAAHALGLAGLDAVPVRIWWAVVGTVLAGVALALGRATRSTATWPLTVLLAAQPVPFLLLPTGAFVGPAGAAVAVAVALLDVVAVLALRGELVPVARCLALAGAGLGAVLGWFSAWGAGPLDSWTATAVLAFGAAVAGTLGREPRMAGVLPPAPVLAGAAAGTAALAAAGSLASLGPAGAGAAGGLGIALLAAAVPAAGRRPTLTALLSAGGVLTVAALLVLLVDGRYGILALLALAGTAPAALAALRLPPLRPAAVGTTLLCPAAAVLLGVESGALGTATAGLLLALLAATGFALGALRAPRPEEGPAVGAGTLVGVLAAATTADVAAWGQTALVLAVTGAAAGGYALVARRPVAAVGAVAALVAAAWTAVGGAGVTTPEAYTLPAAAGLLLLAVPQLRAGVRSWAAEGPAAAVALVPSALVVVAEPSAVRLVLVVVSAAGLVVLGTTAHRQAPFVVGAGSLAFAVLGRLGPYTPLLPRWVVLAAAGLLLLVLGATYERRRQQAREAVAWVAQMR